MGCGMRWAGVAAGKGAHLAGEWDGACAGHGCWRWARVDVRLWCVRGLAAQGDAADVRGGIDCGGRENRLEAGRGMRWAGGLVGAELRRSDAVLDISICM